MIMRYFGGGVGHLKNTPPQQVHGSDPVAPDSEEMEVDDEEGDTGGNTRGDPRDIIMSNGELEVGEDDEEKWQDDNDDETDDNDNGDDDDDESDEEDDMAIESDQLNFGPLAARCLETISHRPVGCHPDKFHDLGHPINF
jgi:hypothetical protein